jgi:hypothetical protein
VTKTGSRYQREDCCHLRKSRRPILLRVARARCEQRKVCKPAQ